MRQWFLLTWMVILMSGCGFKLRGNVTIPEALKQLIIMPESQEPFHHKLQCVFKKRGINFVSPDQKAPVLTIASHNFSHQALGMSPSGQTQQFRLFLELIYSLNAASGEALSTNTIRVSKDFSVDPNMPLSNDSNLDVYKKELENEAILQLLRQITTLKVWSKTITSEGT